MAEFYRVKVSEGSTQAKPEQIINGYLAAFGEVQKYTRGQAIKKARMFNGKIEIVGEINQPYFLHGKRLDIWDNEGASTDRYTIVFTGETPRVSQAMRYYPCISMSSRPDSPTGVFTHGECVNEKHLGKKILFADLPKECKQAMIMEVTKP